MPKEERHSRKHRNIFPVGGFIVLVIGIVWMLNELNVFSINLPWVPLVIIVIGLGIILNHYYRRSNN
jgi:apolipoprotein N-acyltransferase